MQVANTGVLVQLILKIVVDKDKNHLNVCTWDYYYYYHDHYFIFTSYMVQVNGGVMYFIFDNE